MIFLTQLHFFKQLKLLRKASPCQLIQNLLPSAIVWCQCDIPITRPHPQGKMSNDVRECEGCEPNLRGTNFVAVHQT